MVDTMSRIHYILSMKVDNPTALAGRRYIAGFTVAMVAYIAILFAIVFIDKRLHPAEAVRIALYLLPLIPVIFMVPVVVRFLRDTDEFERRIVTDSLAIGAGITAMLSVTYGFLEIAGLPHPSAWWTWIVLMASWGLARCFIARQYR